MTDKINDAKSKTTVKKTSKQKEKDQKNTMGATGTLKTENNMKMQASKGKYDLTQEASSLIQKMNHADWQKRKEAAESMISLLN